MLTKIQANVINICILHVQIVNNLFSHTVNTCILFSYCIIPSIWFYSCCICDHTIIFKVKVFTLTICILIIIWPFEFESINFSSPDLTTCWTPLRCDPPDLINSVSLDVHVRPREKKKVENNVCKYTWRLHGCSPSLWGSIFTQKRRKQDNMLSGCHCATVCGRGASCIQVGGGGKQLFLCLAFIIHAHGHGRLHHGYCNFCSKQFGFWHPDRMWQTVYFSLQF